MTDPTPTAAEVAALVARCNAHAAELSSDADANAIYAATIALEQVQAAREREYNRVTELLVQAEGLNAEVTREQQRAEAAETKNGWRFADEWRERARAAEAELRLVCVEIDADPETWEAAAQQVRGTMCGYDALKAERDRLREQIKHMRPT